MSDYTTYQSGAASGSTLSAFFDSRSDAEDAISQLRDLGIPDASIRLTGEEADGSETTRREPRGFFEALADFFMPDEDRYTYAEGLARGGYLVTVTDVNPELQEQALDLLDAAGTINIDEREESWRTEGWTGYQGSDAAGYASGSSASGTTGGYASGATAGGFAEDRAAFSERDTTLGENETIPVVEERLRVGKRDASHGRVRVRSYVRETPVSEQVELTEERVEIERRPVDRPLDAAEDAFRERSIEAEERREEAVVSKEARVVEEVGLRRERDSRSETISDTVRSTEVEVEDERVDPDATSRERNRF